MLRVKASAAGTLGNSWEFMQKCSERILPRLGMWSCQRKKLFRDEHGIQGGFRIGISKREKQSRVLFQNCVTVEGPPKKIKSGLFGHLLFAEKNNS